MMQNELLKKEMIINLQGQYAIYKWNQILTFSGTNQDIIKRNVEYRLANRSYDCSYNYKICYA